MEQLNLISIQKKKYYGGSLVKGKRKSVRPLSTKDSIHLVLKSQKKIDLFQNRKFIEEKIESYSQRFGVQVYNLSTQKDHIHLSIRIHNREQYKQFIRTLTGILARRFGKGLWKLLPFTRIVSWGKDFKKTQSYIDQNEKEIRGLVSYQIRKKRYY